MKYLTKDLCFRWIRTRRWLKGVQTVLFALGMLGVVSATSESRVELVTVNEDGIGSGYTFTYTISADGRFVAFAGWPIWGSEVFVRDLKRGTTSLVSVNQDGTGSGSGDSYGPVISADGRFVAFVSGADDLVVTDNNGRPDVFVRDLQSGTTSLVSVNQDGTGSGSGDSYGPVISADGRFVAFTSWANDLVVTDNNYLGDVFVRDLKRGTTSLVSVNLPDHGYGSSASRHSYGPVISADGRSVAFHSEVYTYDFSERDVFVRDLKRGTTSLVSVNQDGTGSGSGDSSWPVISANGRFVVFESWADDLVAADNNDESDVFVRDLKRGTTSLVSVNQDGSNSGSGPSFFGSGPSFFFDDFIPFFFPVISADGRFVAFSSWADDLVVTDNNNRSDVFVRDLKNGTTSLVSVNQDGTGSGSEPSYRPVISADGRFVVFYSRADDLVITDNNNRSDVFVRDLKSGTTSLVSVNQDGTDFGSEYSFGPVISADGRVVIFESEANDVNIFAYKVFEAPQGCNCADPNAIKGTAKADFLYGTEQADIICGLGDGDFIAGRGGDDCIDGGDGNDKIYGGSGNDTIFGGAGEDLVYGHHGDDVINGNEGEDYLFGGNDDDKLDGGEGYDWVFCGGGKDEGVGEYMEKCESP